MLNERMGRNRTAQSVGCILLQHKLSQNLAVQNHNWSIRLWFCRSVIWRFHEDGLSIVHNVSGSLPRWLEWLGISWDGPVGDIGLGPQFFAMWLLHTASWACQYSLRIVRHYIIEQWLLPGFSNTRGHHRLGSEQEHCHFKEYLFESRGDKGDQVGDISFLWQFSLKWPQYSGLDQAKASSQELHPDFTCGWQGPM